MLHRKSINIQLTLNESLHTKALLCDLMLGGKKKLKRKWKLIKLILSEFNGLWCSHLFLFSNSNRFLLLVKDNLNVRPHNWMIKLSADIYKGCALRPGFLVRIKFIIIGKDDQEKQTNIINLEISHSQTPCICYVA